MTSAEDVVSPTDSKFCGTTASCENCTTLDETFFFYFDPEEKKIWYSLCGNLRNEVKVVVSARKIMVSQPTQLEMKPY